MVLLITLLAAAIVSVYILGAQTPAVYVQEGRIIPDPTSNTRTGGDVVVIGTIPLVCAPTDPNLPGVNSLMVDGVFDFPKDTSTFTAGDAWYWNASGNPVLGTAGTGCATSTPSAYLGGVVTDDAATEDYYVRGLLTAAKRTTTIAGSVTADDITGSDSSLGIAGKAGNASAGGIVAIAGGAAAAGAYDGGAVTIAGGAGPTAGNTGGALTLLSGAGDGTNGTAGSVILDSSNTGATKGTVTIGTNAASLTLGKMPRVPFSLLNAAGGNIATAAAVTAGWTLVAAQDNSTGVQLPSCVNGAQCIIINMATDKTLKVYPPTGKQINGAGANNAVVMAANTIDVFASEGTNAWYGFTAAIDLA